VRRCARRAFAFFSWNSIHPYQPWQRDRQVWSAASHAFESIESGLTPPINVRAIPIPLVKLMLRLKRKTARAMVKTCLQLAATVMVRA